MFYHLFVLISCENNRWK